MRRLLPALLIGLLLLLSACGPALSEEEAAAFEQLLPGVSHTDITEDVFSQNGEWREKFKAVDRILQAENGDWAVLTRPIGYNGPISLALVIDHETSATSGLVVVAHNETRHYVRGLEEDWFTSRFADKQAGEALRVVRLEAREPSDVVAITGATVTSQAVVNGVNAALSLYAEAVLGKEQAAVPYTVDFQAEQGEGPEENGKLAVRAYGTVLGEITLEEIKELPSVERVLTIHSTAGTTEHRFTGTLLYNVLQAVDPALTEDYDLLMTVGVDEYCSGIEMREVLKENAV
ncbi:MAG: FMN-binding protein [Firmicutes bacterium]|nr:FMN-binding protein [Bacillota bacterium]